MHKLNLGCGPVFLDSPDWINLDFSPISPAVRRTNLLGRLPVGDESTAVVYSSHFLEHVPLALVPGLVRECLRVLRPGGVLRLVLPDLENMAREYLARREACEHDKADFVVMEMIDQCVRRESGGELGRFYGQFGSNSDANSVSLMNYVCERVGEDFRAVSDSKLVWKGRKLDRVFAALYGRIERYWVRLCLLALPVAFRAQNVSLAAVGERHQWLWDFHQLAKALAAAGFVDVQRVSADRSSISDFPFHPLDLDINGRPRKGAESLYIEAIKPKK